VVEAAVAVSRGVPVEVPSEQALTSSTLAMSTSGRQRRTILVMDWNSFRGNGMDGRHFTPNSRISHSISHRRSGISPVRSAARKVIEVHLVR
jgi:hypothetical protein